MKNGLKGERLEVGVLGGVWGVVVSQNPAYHIVPPPGADRSLAQLFPQETGQVTPSGSPAHPLPFEDRHCGLTRGGGRGSSEVPQSDSSGRGETKGQGLRDRG